MLVALFLLFGGSLSPGLATAQTQEAPRLRVGTTLVRTASPGETHAFRVDIDRDRFVFVAVRQEGVDVRVRVVGPEGDTVDVVDSPNGRWGIEPAILVGEDAGSYRVEVEPLEEETQDGEIRVTLERDDPLADTPEGKVNQLFAPWDQPDYPGAAVAVAVDGEIAFSGGYGEAQVEYGIPITPTTVFHVASVSKQFTGFALAMLVDQGLVSLDDDIRTYLPEMPDFGHTITLRHLVHHTSGLRDQWNLLSLAGWRMDDVISKDQVLQVISRQQELNFPPGEEYVYCNTGFTLLGEVVTRVTGTPFPEWMAENVFEPLGMTRTHFHEDHQLIVPDRAYSYVENYEEGLKKAVLSYANVGATSLFTTVEDLSKWMVNLDEATVGGRGAVDLLQNTRGILNNGDTLSYAMGISAGEYRGLKTVGHSGGDAGFRTHAVRFPDHGVAVNVLSNLGSFNPSQMALRVAGVYLEEEMAAAEAAEAQEGEPATALEEPAADETFTLDPATLETYEGSYELQPGVILRLEVSDGRLVAEGPGLPPVALLPTGPDAFTVEGFPVELTFNRDADEAITGMTVLQEGQEQVAEKVAPFDPESVNLTDYEGRYYSPELETFYDLRVEEDAFEAVHIRHGSIALTPSGPDAFTGAAFFMGQVTFERDSAGQVEMMLVSSGRVRNVRFERTGG